MIIISDFHDYYDGVAKSGINTELRYIRKKKKIGDGYQSRWKWRWQRDIRKNYIGFCGKTYPCISDQKLENGPIKYYYTYDELYEGYLKEQDINAYTNKLKRLFKHDIKKWKDWFDKVEREKNNDYNFFIEHRCPIFVNFWHTGLELNSQLSQYEFFRIFDSWSAFQEIQMFLSNMASPEKPIPKIDDKIMAAAKGFDKFSFRKDKQK